MTVVKTPSASEAPEEGCSQKEHIPWDFSFPILEGGRITEAVFTALDVTERKRAEEKLEASERLFRSIFENARIGIGLLKIDSQELSSNRALHEMWVTPE